MNVMADNIKSLKLVVNQSAVETVTTATGLFDYAEKVSDHKKLIDYYLTSKKLRNHAISTVEGTKRVLEKFFEVTNCFCWEVTIEDVNEYHEGLIDAGLSIGTRRSYINVISNFYKFLLAHPEIPQSHLERQSSRSPQRIDWKYGVRLIQPVDKWFMPTHSSENTTVKTALPSKDHLRNFLRFIRTNSEDSFKPLTMQRDYAMFSLMYHTGIRQDECRMLDVNDIYFDHRTIHVRHGKGAKGSGKRERWVPIILNGIDSILTIYLDHVRPHFLNSDKSSALFLSEHGKRISAATIKRRLQENIDSAWEKGIQISRFTCHDLRRAFATHRFEEDPTKLEIIRSMLGHEFLSTTQRYVRPSSFFIEKQLNDWTNRRLNALLEDNDD